MSYISKCSSSVCNTLTDIVISDREIVLEHSKTWLRLVYTNIEALVFNKSDGRVVHTYLFCYVMTIFLKLGGLFGI